MRRSRENQEEMGKDRRRTKARKFPEAASVDTEELEPTEAERAKEMK